MGQYVIQMRMPGGRWDTVASRQYSTLEEAKAFFDSLPIKADHRIAEAYTVTRYKPVKEVRR